MPSLPAGGLSEAEQAAVRAKLWELLASRTAQYTLGDSSSVPEKLAGELLESLCFTLTAGLAAEDAPPRRLATEPLDQLLRRGQVSLREKTAEGERLWKTACLMSAPDIDNVAFRGTLTGIGGFFRQYDVLFLAHEIPCDIDYPLCRPVPEDLQGIDYINEYLRRIIAENMLLCAFPEERIIRLLERSCPDCRGLLINLCEPVLLNAVGLAVIGGEVSALGLSELDRRSLWERLNLLTAGQGRTVLGEAARAVCRRAGIGEGFAQAYLEHAAADQWPRVAAALAAGELSGVFFALE